MLSPHRVIRLETHPSDLLGAAQIVCVSLARQSAETRTIKTHVLATSLQQSLDCAPGQGPGSQFDPYPAFFGIKPRATR